MARSKNLINAFYPSNSLPITQNSNINVKQLQGHRASLCAVQRTMMTVFGKKYTVLILALLTVNPSASSNVTIYKMVSVASSDWETSVATNGNSVRFGIIISFLLKCIYIVSFNPPLNQ